MGRKLQRIYGSNICIDCANACGGCEWSEYDPVRGRTAFRPVPGWTAQEVILMLSKGASRTPRITEGFHITACPKFTPIANTPARPDTRGGRRARPVVGTAPDGTEQRFESIKVAAIEIPRASGGIYNVLAGAAKTAGGYRWRYDDGK